MTDIEKEGEERVKIDRYTYGGTILVANNFSVLRTMSNELNISLVRRYEYVLFINTSSNMNGVRFVTQIRCVSNSFAHTCIISTSILGYDNITITTMATKSPNPNYKQYHQHSTTYWVLHSFLCLGDALLVVTYIQNHINMFTPPINCLYIVKITYLLYASYLHRGARE